MAPSGKAPTIYSNIMNVRTTPAELVFEFGSHFPEKPDLAPPNQFEADVRIVLPIQALARLLDALTKAVKDNAAQATAAGPDVSKAKAQ